ncbi:hypothetical protein [Rhizobium rhizophilum]|uniref:Adenylate cyclase n=1 Tax=Rhizobium rhizophilum TaxID=1850373 RepID=A0ABY2QNG2_9HYPH|nr:hypothetical protein [Rhizobium rhizophilum]THV10706.1 hypothetical protein E9677_23470 [Rhizobium rhizophilum]
MSTDARIDNRQVAEALRSVLTSRTFARSERLRSFLKFVVEMEQLGLAHQLKGYTIGIDVFSRSEGFDPGTDPLVRVQAGKLRRLLNQFYAEEGRDEALRIRIPLGGYVPMYELAGTARRSRIENDDRTDISRWRGLPNLFLAPLRDGDATSRIFVNALRFWTGRLWAVAIAACDAQFQEQNDQGSSLHFILEVKDEGATRLSLSLRHQQSGNEVLATGRTLDASGDILDIASLANQFAGVNLTIPGRIYQFCHANNLSTAEMKCLDATYRYTLEGTPDAYIAARRHQQQWPGLGGDADIITEIPRLIALSTQHI